MLHCIQKPFFVWKTGKVGKIVSFMIWAMSPFSGIELSCYFWC